MTTEINHFPNDEQIENLLKKLDIKPSSKFYERMEKAPWQKSFQFPSLFIKVAAAAVVLTTLIFISPNLAIDPNPTSTPTSTHAANHLPEPLQGFAPLQTPQPENPIY